jgi:cell division protein FtsQ
MRIKSSVKKMAGYIASTLMLMGLIGFVESQKDLREVRSVNIMLEHNKDYYFLEEDDILSLITESGARPLEGQKIAALDLKALEDRISSNRYTAKVAVFVDLKGNLVARASQKEPLARFADPVADDWYIDEHGELLPLSEKFAARVILVSGKTAKKWYQDEQYEKEKLALTGFLKHIKQQEFWSAQIAEVEVDEKGELVLYPQIGRQVIEFGDLENADEKLRRLMIFYKRILPSQGWNTYARVNVSFENQIICE